MLASTPAGAGMKKTVADASSTSAFSSNAGFGITF
jgi:hypothetical protein